jgi:cytochrome c biogenesis protein CcmG, thiol:disulfide interchange protein DsbE
LSTEIRSSASPWAPRLAALVVGLGVVALLALFVWSLGNRVGVGAVQVASRPAPDINLTIFARPAAPASPWRLADQSGQVVLVNFWASWCIPCEEEAPALEAAAQRYRGRVSFLGVDVQDSEANARAFLDRYRVSYPNAPDGSGEVSIAYGMSGVPESYFVGQDGRIARKWAGPLDEARLSAFLEELLR